MHPVILFGHGAHHAFDPFVHPPGVGFDIIRREIRPGITYFNAIALSAGQHPRHAGDDGRTRQPGEAGQPGNGGRLNPKEGNENRIPAAKIHVRQVIERAAGFHGPNAGAGAFLAGEQQLIAKPAAPPKKQAIKNGIRLFGKNADDVKARGNRCAAGVQTDKMRRQQHDRATGFTQGVDFFLTLNADQARQALAAAPPQQAAFQHAAAERLEMRPGQFIPLRPGQFGKAQGKIDPHNMPAFFCQEVQHPAQAAPDRRQQGQRQEMQDPEQRDDEAIQHGFGERAGRARVRLYKVIKWQRSVAHCTFIRQNGFS